MWILLFFIPAVLYAVCDFGNDDPDTYINSDCNLVGFCEGGGSSGNQCLCCDTSAEDDICEGLSKSYAPGQWVGDACDRPTQFITIKVGIHVPSGTVECPDDGVNPSNPDLREELTAVANNHNFTGEFIPIECQTCSTGNPCVFTDTRFAAATSGVLVRLGTDLNTYYDLGCGLSTLPQGSLRPCDLNIDYGAEAFVVMNNLLSPDEDFHTFRQSLIAEADLADGAISYAYMSLDSATGSTYRVTFNPTPTPTESPVSSGGQTIPCQEYGNDLSDVKYLGAGASCRASMNESWTGGRTCESPYIVCLPEENTPAFDLRGNRYKNNTHRYTVEECKAECSYDQGCLGVEFRADTNSSAGSCMLLSIEPEIEDENHLYEYNSNATNLDNSTGVNAICWSKRDYCNPFFQAEALSDVMLSCYCPNNRKGVYTKKVKRIVNNTRFCDNDSSVDERIRLAQANRMFHLCENWCLFETYNPEQENWYWDPWKQCWRETYSGSGLHRSYCDRVIRNPDSIELQFLNHRQEHFCISEPPTPSPVPDVNTSWYLADVLESCDGVCGRHDRVCAAEQTTRRFETESELIDAFAEVGQECRVVAMNSTARAGWALPAISVGRLCVNRQPPIDHLMDLDSDCRRKTGTRWQRLCACY